MFTCMECETNIEVNEDAEVEDVVQCPECDCQLVVISLPPPTVDYIT